jgi:hypothetical protein
MTMNWPGKTCPWPAVHLLDLDEVLFGGSCTLSRMRTAGMTKPISAAIWRRRALICSVSRSSPAADVDQRQEAVAELDPQVVHLERGRDRLLGGRARR